MLNASQVEFRLLFDTIGDTISGLPKILFYEGKKNEFIRMLYEQLELISFYKWTSYFIKLKICSNTPMICLHLNMLQQWIS